MSGGQSMPLEVLDLTLVSLRGPLGSEGAEIAALAGARTFLARIEPVLPAGEFADHRRSPAERERPAVIAPLVVGLRTVIV